MEMKIIPEQTRNEAVLLAFSIVIKSNLTLKYV